MQKLLPALLPALLFAGRAASVPDGPGPGPGDKVACTEDELYVSLSDSGADFCESLVKLHCEVSTPPEYTTYDAGQISSQVSSSHPLTWMLGACLRWAID